MEVQITPGKYIIAVSGGVDSVVLLDILAKQHNNELIVAHFDHGIRSDSEQDRKFVEDLAKKYNLEFEFTEGNLGAKASEELARNARYSYLQAVKKKHNAQAIITAHHQDDVLETVIINMLRGTGRKGISSLQSSSEIIRPLVSIPKTKILEYAKISNLKWREDSTNSDDGYLRNWVRHNIIPKLTVSQKQYLLAEQQKFVNINKEIDAILSALVGKDNCLNRHLVIMLPHNLSKELVAYWLRRNNIDFDSKLIEKIVINAKTLTPGKKTNISKELSVNLCEDRLCLVSTIRKDTL